MTGVACRLKAVLGRGRYERREGGGKALREGRGERRREGREKREGDQGGGVGRVGGDAAYLATCISRFLPPEWSVTFLSLVGKRVIKRRSCTVSMLLMQPVACYVHQDLNK